MFAGLDKLGGDSIALDRPFHRRGAFQVRHLGREVSHMSFSHGAGFLQLCRGVVSLLPFAGDAVNIDLQQLNPFFRFDELLRKSVILRGEILSFNPEI